MSKHRIWAILLSFCTLVGCRPDEDSEKTLIVSPETVWNLVENGVSGDYLIALSDEPSAPVTVNIFTTQLGVVALSETSVVIRPEDWRYGKNIRVACLDNNIPGNQTMTVVFATSSVDASFANLTQTRTIVCMDNDAGQIDPEEPPVIDPVDPPIIEPEDPPVIEQGTLKINVVGALATNENGGTTTMNVALSSQPEDDVLVFVQSSDVSEGTVSPSQLTFTSVNWNIEQTVTVTGVDDDEIDGAVPYKVIFTVMSSDDAYDELDDIEIPMTNHDNESSIHRPQGTPGVFVSPVAGLKTSEKGEKATFSVALQAVPLHEVNIPVVSSDVTEGKVDISMLSFTTKNWSVPQTVTITGQDDKEADGNVAYMIQLGPAQSRDNRYQNMLITGVRVTNLDDDPPDVPASITVSRQTLSIEESGAPGTFKIALGTKPIADVQIAVSVSDETEGAVSPSLLTFTEKNWNMPQTVMVSGIVDGIEDGTQTFNVEFEVSSEDSRYANYKLDPITVTSADSDVHTGSSIKLRIMAANISSGNYQAYSPGHGVRIFQAVKPDIVLIQEFNWNATGDSDVVVQELITTAFGEDYTFYRGSGSIPNGVISRYPIMASGSWKSNQINNRDWDWAVVDLPGPKELLLVSVHLSTDKNASEMPVLIENIQDKLDEDAKHGQEYFVMIGGDFNTSSRNPVFTHMSSIFTTSAPFPMDQKGNTNTNANRNNPYDYLLCSPDWCKFEVPVEIGTHTGANAYKNGHIFDSRVYGKTTVGSGTELDYVPPVQKDDSGATNMQHMAVIRDFEYTY